MKFTTCTARFHSECLYQWMELSELPLEQACPAKCYEGDVAGEVAASGTGAIIKNISEAELADAYAKLQATTEAAGAQLGGWLRCE